VRGRRTAKAVGLTSLLIGPPAVLIWWAGWPLPTTWPDRQQVESWLERPVTPALAAVAGWTIWAAVVYAVMVRPDRQLRRTVETIQSWGGLALLLVGLPAGLIWWAGWPLPGWPTLVQLQAWLAEPLTWPTIVVATAMIGWVFWAVLVYAAAVELASRLGRVLRWLPRLPIPTPFQGLVTGLFGAAALTMNTPTSQLGTAVDVGLVATVDQPVPAIPGTSPLAGPAPTKDAVRPQVGVELPEGGWLAPPLADVVSGAAAFTWFLRRYRYQPRPPSGQPRTDPDLAPMPPTVAAIQTARGRTIRAEASLSGDGLGPGLVVIGRRGTASLLAGDVPAGGVGLTGPGAWDAGRGLLAAHLLADPAPHGLTRLITTAEDVRTLLGGPAGEGLPNIQVAGSLGEALSLVDRHLLNRAANGRPADATGNSAASGAGGTSLLVLTGVPTDLDSRSRLAVLLSLGHQHQLHGVLLGGWSSGTTWHVNRDGTVSDAADTTRPLRLTTLPSAAAADLVTLAAHATGSPSTGPITDLDPFGHTPTGSPPETAPELEAPLSVHLLGPVSVTVHGRSINIGRSAGVQLLVLLALNPDGLTSHQLGEAIWPQQRPHLVSGRFHTTVSDLRRTLHHAAGQDVLDRSAGRYRLHPGTVDVDVWRLRHQIIRAGTAAGLTARDTALRAVVNLYRGELAAGEQWPWLAAHREALRRDVIDAYTALAAAHPDQAVYLLPAAARIDPINAHLHEHAVHALLTAGDHAAAATLTDRHLRHLTAAGLTPNADRHTHLDARASRPRPR